MNQQRIVSFVRRGGRLTARQQHALSTLWPQYGISFQTEPLDLASLFGRDAPVIFEIGFGNGQTLLTQASAHPDYNFLGIEVYRAGVGTFIASCFDQKITNVRVLQTDAVEVLRCMIPDASLHKIQIFFPDPWHKQKHQKRRLVQPEFIDLAVSKLQVGGVIHCATDWQDYAKYMLKVLQQQSLLLNLADDGGYYTQATDRAVTRFEQRGQRLGHGVWDLLFRRHE